MSNRTLWILIIFWFIMAIYAYYEYFFVYNLVNIKIISNQDNYQVELYNKKVFSTTNYLCTNKECDINWLSPFKYDVKIIKNWFKEFTTNIDLNIDKKLFIDLEKQSSIEFENNIESNLYESKLYKASSSNIKKDFIFKINLNKLNLYYRWKKIWSFDYKKKYIDDSNKINFAIYDILWEKSYVYFVLADEKYLLNLDFYNFKKINFQNNILYIKKMNKFTYQLVTQKWTFLYDYMKNTIEYFDKFQDFIFIDNNYITYIDKSDNRRRKNLWLEKKSWNIILLYNQDTKEKTILDTTDLNIIKIYKKNDNNVYFLTSDFKEYKIKYK